MPLTSSIIKIIESTLNYVDPRLMNHGKRVAYLVYKVLVRQNRHSEEFLRQAALLGLLHDVGAYKTEEINNMVHFETGTVWEHSAYGYLFIKYFSPLSELAPVILFHHANCTELRHVAPQFRELTQLIHIADRFDILTQTGQTTLAEFRQYFSRHSGTKFDSTLVEWFFHDGWESLFQGMDTDPEFQRLLYYTGYFPNEITAFIKMLVLSVDFRSPQTVTHSLTATCVCKYIAPLLDMDPREREYMYIGTMLHDIGKVGIPLRILEKTGRLTDEERGIMQQHVHLTEAILSGCVAETSLHLSTRHHEKLNGTGYPRGLKGNDLSTGQRLIAVADIFSALCGTRSYKKAFPKEKVIAIMEDMGRSGLIDGSIVAQLIMHYDILQRLIREEAAPITRLYAVIQQEYTTLLNESACYGRNPGLGEIVA